MNRKIRVWFNHWFSTAYHIINLIKEDKDIDFYIIGSNENHDSPIQQVCEKWFQEPKFSNDGDYVDYCLKFCSDNDIHIFVPRRKMVAIGNRLEEFEALGVKVLVEKDPEKLRILNDKEETYKYFEKLGINLVPERYVVNNGQGFINAYKEITNRYDRACIKFTQDEGAMSFRVIDNIVEGFQGLKVKPGLKVSYKAILDSLSQEDSFSDLFVMPYLEGIEVSVDCLGTPSGTIIVPRYKTGSRITEIRYEKEIVDYCKEIYEKINIFGPCNIQFKYHNNVPYLLEVNTRMSGGIQLSCLSSDVNIPNIAVNQLLDIHKPWKIETITKKVTYIEKPLLL